jgi:hypothetical protein
MSALKKITARAKQIRKAHPSMKWMSAIKKASVEFNLNKTGVRNKTKHPRRAKKKTTMRSRRRKVSAIDTVSRTHTDYNKPEVNISIGGLKTVLRKKLNQALDKKVIRKFHATGKRQKKKIQKEINAVKSELRKLSLI